MTKYVTRACFVNSPSYEDPRSIFGTGSHCEHSFEVHEADGYRDTGLLDAKGNTIWATDKGPLGFGRA